MTKKNDKTDTTTVAGWFGYVWAELAALLVSLTKVGDGNLGAFKVPENVSIFYGHPASRAFTDETIKTGPDGATVRVPARRFDLYPPESDAKRGNIANRPRTLADAGDPDGDLKGPSVSDGNFQLYISPRIGNGLDTELLPLAREYDIATTMYHAMILCGLGKPEPRGESGRTTVYGNRWKEVSTVAGFDDGNTEYRLRTSVADRILAICSSAGAFPEGYIAGFSTKRIGESAAEMSRVRRLECPAFDPDAEEGSEAAKHSFGNFTRTFARDNEDEIAKGLPWTVTAADFAPLCGLCNKRMVAVLPRNGVIYNRALETINPTTGETYTPDEAYMIAVGDVPSPFADEDAPKQRGRRRKAATTDKTAAA